MGLIDSMIIIALYRYDFKYASFYIMDDITKFSLYVWVIYTFLFFTKCLNILTSFMLKAHYIEIHKLDIIDGEH